MRRAAVSIPSNIAEGYERDTDAEFVRYLNIAKGSAAELRTQIYIAKEVGEIAEEQAMRLVQECKEISAMLHALAKTRKSKIKDEADALADYDAAAEGSYLNPET